MPWLKKTNPGKYMLKILNMHYKNIELETSFKSQLSYKGCKIKWYSSIWNNIPFLGKKVSKIVISSQFDSLLRCYKGQVHCCTYN